MSTILHAIGNTPLIKLQKLVPPGAADVYVKLEYFNPTGSYKDRMALAIIEAAEGRGDLKKGMNVIECTGGSTGTSMAFVCMLKGYRFKAISSDAFAKEKLKAIQMFGGELDIVPSEGGKITPNLIPSLIAKAEVMAKQGAYWTNQFKNRDALDGYKIMGKEILAQLKKPVDEFCAAVGTAGMAAGVSVVLKEANPKTKITFLEPASAPLLSKGEKGSHKVEGIGVGLIPPLLEFAKYDEVRTVDEQEARKMANLLASQEGILAGTSTGLNIVAAIDSAKKLGAGHTVVTVACDSGMKYMTGGLFD